MFVQGCCNDVFAGRVDGGDDEIKGSGGEGEMRGELFSMVLEFVAMEKDVFLCFPF